MSEKIIRFNNSKNNNKFYNNNDLHNNCKNWMKKEALSFKKTN
jgi:hypothetical protein